VGLKKSTTFKIKVANRQRVVRWILTIRDSEGNVVRSFQGYKSPPTRLEWNGMDAGGRIVKAGNYSYRLSITDRKDVTEVTPIRNIKIMAPTPFEIEAR